MFNLIHNFYYVRYELNFELGLDRGPKTTGWIVI